MWVLEAQPLGSTDDRSPAVQNLRHYLVAGSHFVGRNSTAEHSGIVVEEDKSISRQHAVVTVSYAAPPTFRVKDMGRYGTLVNKQALNGQEATLKEGDFLQFGHKSSFRVRRWHCSVAPLQDTPSLQQYMMQLGFVAKEAKAASCILTPDRVPLTADLACTFAYQKAYTTEAWLQAVLQRPLLSDPPPNMADYSPVVISGPSAQEMHLQPVFDQQLLAGYLLIVPPSLTQVSPGMVEAIQQYGGCISTDVGQSSAAAMRVLVVTDMQTADLGKLPPNTIELHLTTVDHILTAMLHGTTDGMTQQVSQDEVVKAVGLPPAALTSHAKRKASPGADLGPPSSKRRHTQAAEADKAVQNSHAHAAPGSASEQPMSSSSMQSQGSMLLPANMPRTTHAEVVSAQPIEAVPAASHQTASHQDGANDNNAILWEPLVVRVYPAARPSVLSDDPSSVTNFKKFRKVQAEKPAPFVPYANRGYAENNIDTEAFLNQQRTKQRQQQVAEELFNANVRVQKQSAIPLSGATATKAGRGRGRGR